MFTRTLFQTLTYSISSEVSLIFLVTLSPPKRTTSLTFFSEQEKVLETEFDGEITEHSMLQIWPVRQPRPVAEKLPANYPLLTGQRILDALFP